MKRSLADSSCTTTSNPQLHNKKGCYYEMAALPEKKIIRAITGLESCSTSSTFPHTTTNASSSACQCIPMNIKGTGSTITTSSSPPLVCPITTDRSNSMRVTFQDEVDIYQQNYHDPDYELYETVNDFYNETLTLTKNDGTMGNIATNAGSCCLKTHDMDVVQDRSSPEELYFRQKRKEVLGASCGTPRKAMMINCMTSLRPISDTTSPLSPDEVVVIPEAVQRLMSMDTIMKPYGIPVGATSHGRSQSVENDFKIGLSGCGETNVLRVRHVGFDALPQRQRSQRNLRKAHYGSLSSLSTQLLITNHMDGYNVNNSHHHGTSGNKACPLPSPSIATAPFSSLSSLIRTQSACPDCHHSCGPVDSKVRPCRCTALSCINSEGQTWRSSRLPFLNLDLSFIDAASTAADTVDQDHEGLQSLHTSDAETSIDEDEEEESWRNARQCVLGTFHGTPRRLIHSATTSNDTFLDEMTFTAGNTA